MKNKIPKAKNLQKIVVFLSLRVYLYINIIYVDGNSAVFGRNNLNIEKLFYKFVKGKL